MIAVAERTYNFREKLTEGQIAERNLALHIQNTFPGTLVKPASRSQDRGGIDLWIKRPDDGEVVSIQVKVDYKMETTSNFFIETVSVVPDKPGWIWTTNADIFCYIDAGDWTVYWLQMVQLRTAFNNYWKYRREVTSPNEGWLTKGVLVNKAELIHYLHPLTTNLLDDPEHDPFSDCEPGDEC